MRGNILRWLKGLRPPLLLWGTAAVFFCGAAMGSVATEWGRRLPKALLYMIYTGAMTALTFAVWSLVLWLRAYRLRKVMLETIHKKTFTGKMYDDYSFRTVVCAYASFGVNVVFAVSKGIAGWLASSSWLISLAAYYLILCLSKLLLLLDSRRLSGITDQRERLIREWKAYRVCGLLLLLLTVVLQGVVVLIMRNGNTFNYYGMLILAVALYDFCCLISAVIYMVKTRKNHSPLIVAIKTVNFTTSLVSMLSLQTAMFASFGTGGETVKQNTMNLITGSVVCVIVLALSLAMIFQASAKIKHIGPGPS